MNKKVNISFEEILIICFFTLSIIAIVWAGVEAVISFIKNVQLHGGVWEYFDYLFKIM